MTIQEILILAGVSVGLPIIATCVLLCAADALDSWAEGPKQEEQKPPPKGIRSQITYKRASHQRLHFQAVSRCVPP